MLLLRPTSSRSTICDSYITSDEVVTAVLEASPQGLDDCPAGSEVEVQVLDVTANVFEDQDFYIQLNR